MLLRFAFAVDDFRIAVAGFDLLDGLELDDACLFIMVPFNFQCYEDAHSLTHHLGRYGDGDATDQVRYSRSRELIPMNLENPALHHPPPKRLNGALH